MLVQFSFVPSSPSLHPHPGRHDWLLACLNVETQYRSAFSANVGSKPEPCIFQTALVYRLHSMNIVMKRLIIEGYISRTVHAIRAFTMQTLDRPIREF